MRVVDLQAEELHARGVPRFAAARGQEGNENDYDSARQRASV